VGSLQSVAEVAELVRRCHRIVVLTGAGISTDSGIPDFRGPQGLWTLNPKAERISSLQHYLADAEVRQIAWQSRVQSPAWDAQPNAGHEALVALERNGRLHTLVTQNIDGLHQRAGNSPDRMVEIHGSMHRAICWSCQRTWPMQTFLDRVRHGESDPACLECGGIVKSTTISFGQSLVQADLLRAMAAAVDGDLLLAIGTTLAVGPINQMVPRAVRSGVPVVIVNGSETEMDELAVGVVNGPIAEVLPRLLATSSATHSG
jgi:NAD-dependent deacetylase